MKIRKAQLSLLLILVLLLGSIMQRTVHAEATNLSSEQTNAIAMLNYITVLTQDINASKNSRVYMEDAYSTLINNIYPNAVDSRTLSQMTGLLDTMESYRMINVKRDRLRYIFDQSQAQAIRAAIPNPMGLIGAVHSISLEKLIASVVYMAVDSYTSYTAYIAEAEQQYLKDGWALDDEEAEVLHESRKDTFSYMIRIVNDYNIPGDLTLTEDTVKEFVSWKNNSNVVGRIQFLESNKATYQSYGGYWLVLAESYYRNHEYRKCLDAVKVYESMGVRIFRRDYELAKILPVAIAAAKKEYSIGKYAPYAAEKAQLIVNNTDHNDWALRYFAAQTFADLYSETKDESYLQNAYKITLDNANYLVSEQKELNVAYLAKVQEKIIPKGADKDEKQQIEKYNKMLNETRKTELPPVYEPLMLNCDLLFALADEMDLQEKEKIKIDRMLHSNGERLFLTEDIDNQYWFENTASTNLSKDDEIEFDGTEMTLSAGLVTKDTAITITVQEPGNAEPFVFTDWKIDETVRRTEGNIDTFKVIYNSKLAKKHNWVPGASINIIIESRDDIHLSRQYRFITEGTKNAWYDYLKVWEGHKNNWYDYAKLWENSVVFVRVD